MEYNPDIHHRKSIRLKGYDYSNTGVYFVTICTHSKESVFRDTIFRNTVPRSLDVSLHLPLCPLPNLNRYGEIIQQHWNNIPNHFQHVVLNEFVIMPNHIHGIIRINPCTGQGEATNQGGGTPQEGGETHQEGGGTPPLRMPTLGQIVGYFKYQTTKTINQIDNTPNRPIWQRNYYERIIRTETDYFEITKYIRDNPQNWHYDEENPCRGGVSACEKVTNPANHGKST
ncbi:MAG: hypothetical protein QME49_00415 [bacterium]|nr:hypothetical protein [bacterium]